MTRGDFWAGTAVLVASMWFLGVSLEKEFMKRVRILNEIITRESDRHR